MKTAILRFFSWKTLLEFAAKILLGPAWNLIKGTVLAVEEDFPGASGADKFKVAYEVILKQLKKTVAELPKERMLRWGIETAVGILKG